MFRALKKMMQGRGQALLSARHLLSRLNEATFGRHLLLTNISVSVSLSALGDSLQQRYQMERGRRNSYDRRRTGYMSGCGLGVGFLCHYWYLALDRWWVGRTFGIVTKKVLVDQLVFSPVLISIFLVSLEAFRGGSLQDMASTLKAKFVRLYMAEWAIWPPAQTFSFYCLPTRYRVLWDNVVSLGYDVYASYVVHDDGDDDDDDDDDLPFQETGAIERIVYKAEDL